MPTTTHLFLNTGGGEGWASTFSSGTPFDSKTYSSNLLAFVKNPTTVDNYGGAMRMGASSKTYLDCGVPVGAHVVGIRLLEGTCATAQSPSTLATLTCNISTDEQDLGTYDCFLNGFIDNSGGAVLPINKTASDFIRLRVEIQAGVDFDGTGTYGTLELQVDHLNVEITYEVGRYRQFFNSI